MVHQSCLSDTFAQTRLLGMQATQPCVLPMASTLPLNGYEWQTEAGIQYARNTRMLSSVHASFVERVAGPSLRRAAGHKSHKKGPCADHASFGKRVAGPCLRRTTGRIARHTVILVHINEGQTETTSQATRSSASRTGSPRAAEWTHNAFPDGSVDNTRVVFVRGVSRCPAEAWTCNPLPEGGMESGPGMGPAPMIGLGGLSPGRPRVWEA